MKLRKAPFLAAALSVPLQAHALGLGPITLHSALNEPLDAEIALLSVRGAQLEDLRVRLAEGAAFEQAGLEQPYVLSRLRFRLAEDADGQPVVKVTSADPVREPVLSFLMEVNWPNGRLLREYTVLLDPPLYSAAGAAAVEGPRAEHGVVLGEQAAPRAAAPEPPAPPAFAERALPGAGAGTWTVRPNETLWSIASETRPEGVSVQQMMLALVEANPEAFIGGNVNALKAGYVLRIPETAEATRVSRQEALAEVRRQYAAWRAQRERYGEAPAAPAPAAPAAPEAPAPAAEGPADEPPAGELRLVSPGQGEEGGAGGQVEALRDELLLAREELDTRTAENAELRSRLAETESIIEDLKSLVELKDEAMAALESRLREQAAAPEAPMPPGVEGMPEGEAMPEEALPATPGPEQAMPAEPEAPEAPQPAPTEPPQVAQEPPPAERPAPTILPPPPAEAPGPASALPVSPAVLGGLGAAVLAVLGAVALLLRRRRREDVTPVPEAAPGDAAGATPERSDLQAGGAAAAAAAGAVGVAAGQAAARGEEETGPPTEEVEAFGEPAAGGTEVSETESVLDEANVYLAYERYDQAESLVRDALEQEPGRSEYWLKLLEVHHAAGAVPAFAASALAMREALGDDHPAVERADSWWQELAPGEDMAAAAAGAGEEPTLVGLDQEEPGETPELERTARFDLSDMESTQETRTEEAGPLDFELDLGDEGQAASRTGELDLDLSLEGEASGAAEPGKLDFELDLEEPEARGDELPGAEPAAEGQPGAEPGARAGDLEGLDFDLGELEAGPEPRREGGTPAEGETDLDFDLGEPEAPSQAQGTEPEAPGAPEPPRDEMGLDFDLGESEVPSEAQRVEAEAPGTPEPPRDEMALDFDLGESEVASEAERAQAGQPAAPEEPRDDSGLDFDLGDQDVHRSTVDLGEAEPAAPGDKRAEEEVPLDLDFDLEAGDEAQTQTVDHVEEPEEDTSTLDEEGLDFEIEMGEEEPREREATPAELGELGVDLDLGEPGEPAEAPSTEPEAAEGRGEAADFDLGLEPESSQVRAAPEEPEFGFDLDLEPEEGEAPARTADLGAEGGGDIDEIGTKLDLAQAYIDMGDSDGARAILDEVLSEGDESQQAEARQLLDKLA